MLELGKRKLEWREEENLNEEKKKTRVERIEEENEQD
jgi:hypothetical protein